MKKLLQPAGAGQQIKPITFKTSAAQAARLRDALARAGAAGLTLDIDALLSSELGKLLARAERELEQLVPVVVTQSFGEVQNESL